MTPLFGFAALGAAIAMDSLRSRNTLRKPTFCTYDLETPGEGDQGDLDLGIPGTCFDDKSEAFTALVDLGTSKRSPLFDGRFLCRFKRQARAGGFFVGKVAGCLDLEEEGVKPPEVFSSIIDKDDGLTDEQLDKICWDLEFSQNRFTPENEALNRKCLHFRLHQDFMRGERQDLS